MECSTWPERSYSLRMHTTPNSGPKVQASRSSSVPLSIHSSASSTRFQSALAAARAALRAAEKSSTQVKWWTCAPHAWAIATVSSVEPVSSTIMRSTCGLALSRQRSMQAASLRAMTTSAISDRVDPVRRCLACLDMRTPNGNCQLVKTKIKIRRVWRQIDMLMMLW